MNEAKQFNSIKEFYPYYLSEHRDPRCRALHFVGSTWGLICLVYALAARQPIFILWGLIGGYACAWVGHFAFEKNKPATFKYPFYSFACDWLMYRDMWLRRL